MEQLQAWLLAQAHKVSQQTSDSMCELPQHLERLQLTHIMAAASLRPSKPHQTLLVVHPNQKHRKENLGKCRSSYPSRQIRKPPQSTPCQFGTHKDLFKPHLENKASGKVILSSSIIDLFHGQPRTCEALSPEDEESRPFSG